VKVADAFYVIGRKDRMAERMGNGRKSLVEIIDGIDHQYPLILMDHEPIGLDEARKNGIDLQLSGHTHHGQLFPFNYITKAVYEV
jgi:predicted MPP superfamily phosphohydrolase